MNLTEKEQLVKVLIFDEKMTEKQASYRLKISERRIRKIKAQIARKLTPTIPPSKSGGFPPPYLNEKNLIRIHGLMFKITFNFTGKRYFERLKKSNILRLENNTIQLFKKNLLVSSLGSFYGKDATSALIEAQNYYWDFFVRLEDYLGIVFLKEKSQNVKIVKSHYSEVNNELAKDCNSKKLKIAISDRVDGKDWFIIDNSFNLNEMETLHPKTALQDMEKVKPFFESLRKLEEPVEMDKVLSVLDKQAHNVNEISKGLLAVIKIITPKESNNFNIQESEIKKDKPDYVG